MPRVRSQTREVLVAQATERFWASGFAATSMDDLVAATASSRAAIYGQFGGKDALFLACLEHYRAAIVTPAFARVEADGAGLDAVRDYFEFQISAGERSGLPGPGCLFANTMTEVAPRSAAIRRLVAAHHDRLKAGFLNAIQSAHADGQTCTATDLNAMADLLATSAHGLWNYSRIVRSAEPLRMFARTLMELIACRLRA
jgi:TetR/AcrR family transcriptional regulator, transcriptional repressor for nem operon